MKEIINPHDKYYINVDDQDAAIAAVLIIGNGKYGIADIMPPLIFGGLVDKWFLENKGKTVTKFIEDIAPERIITAAHTVERVGELSSTVDLLEIAHSMRLQEELP